MVNFNIYGIRLVYATRFGVRKLHCVAELIPERTRTGLSAARAREKKGGRKQEWVGNLMYRMGKKMLKDPGFIRSDICGTLKILRAPNHKDISLD